MKKNIKYLVLVGVVLFSCNGNNSTNIAGTWHAYKLENAAIDSEFSWAKTMIDTLGMGHDDQTNIALYQTANIDSLRSALQQQRQEAMELQKNAVKNTVFHLQANGVALLSFNGEMDSSKWKFNSGNKQLVFTDMHDATKGDSILMDIVALNDTLLKIRMTKESDTSIISFRREGKL